jgi:hypothetical protein
VDRRAFLGAATSVFLGACASPVVRRVEASPFAPDPRGAVLVVVDGGRSRYGPVFVGTTAILGACVTLTHFVTRLPPGRHFIVAYDDDSYDACEADVAPGAIYALEVAHLDGELEVRPLVPGRDPIRRLLDETDRVELVRAPRRRDVEEHERKVRLARLRWADYSASKRAARALGPAHAWR